MSNNKNKSKRVVNASKRSAIAEHLVNKPDCASNCNLKRFKVIKSCYNIFGLIKLGAICTLLRKPKLCIQKYLIILFLCSHK